MTVSGKSTLPDGSCVGTELWAGGVPRGWWPNDACAPVQDGLWWITIPLETEQRLTAGVEGTATDTVLSYEAGIPRSDDDGQWRMRYDEAITQAGGRNGSTSESRRPDRPDQRHILHSLGVLVPLGVSLFAPWFNGAPLWRLGDAVTVSAVVLGVSGVFLAIGTPSLIAGIGLLKHRDWARILAIVLAILAVTSFPMGTVASIYTLWVLTRRETEQLLGMAV